MQTETLTEILDTGEAVSLEQALAEEIQTMPEVERKFESPAGKYPKGFKFNRLRRDGTVEEGLEIVRYNPSKKTFIVNRSIGQTEMPLERIEAITAPELAKHPVGTEVIVPLGKKKVAGKMAGYLEERDEYVVLIHEPGKKSRLEYIPRESFEAVNYREVREKIYEILH